MRHTTMLGQPISGTWLTLALAFPCSTILRVLFQGVWMEAVHCVPWMSAVLFALHMFLQHRDTFMAHRERLFLLMGCGRVATQLLMGVGAPVLPIVVVTCLRHQDMIIYLLANVAEQVSGRG